MTDTPQISVIIPVFNAERTLERCVASVIAARPAPLEIILVDDASSDETPALIRTLSERYPSVKSLRLAANSGPAKARNEGAALAAGDTFFFVDSDTEMLPDALAQFIRRIPFSDAVTGVYHYESLNPAWTARYKALLNNYFFSRQGVIPYEVFDSSRAGIRAEVFRRLGGFNENIRWGMDFENEEFGYRLVQSYRNVLDPSIAVKHHFPGFRKTTRDYFYRASLWMELFWKRRRFESGGVTSAQTGASTAALPAALACLVAAAWHPVFLLAAAGLGAIYLWGYAGFFGFVLKKRPAFVPAAVVLNIYFNVVLLLASLDGTRRVITGRARSKDEKC